MTPGIMSRIFFYRRYIQSIFFGSWERHGNTWRKTVQIGAKKNMTNIFVIKQQKIYKIVKKKQQKNKLKTREILLTSGLKSI